MERRQFSRAYKYKVDSIVKRRCLVRSCRATYNSVDRVPEYANGQWWGENVNDPQKPIQLCVSRKDLCWSIECNIQMERNGIVVKRWEKKSKVGIQQTEKWGAVKGSASEMAAGKQRALRRLAGEPKFFVYSAR